MKYKINYSNLLKKDYKKAKKRGLDINELNKVIRMLGDGKKLPIKYRDHRLKDDKRYKDARGCHLSPDWLLIYKKEEDIAVLTLDRTGTHSDLFG